MIEKGDEADRGSLHDLENVCISHQGRPPIVVGAIVYQPSHGRSATTPGPGLSLSNAPIAVPRPPSAMPAPRRKPHTALPSRFSESTEDGRRRSARGGAVIRAVVVLVVAGDLVRRRAAFGYFRLLGAGRGARLEVVRGNGGNMSYGK